MAIAKYAELLERPPQVSMTWKAALYIRLSREDGDKAESNSITSQDGICQGVSLQKLQIVQSDIQK